MSPAPTPIVGGYLDPDLAYRIAQLEALPVRSAVVDCDRDVWQKRLSFTGRDRWFMVTDDECQSSDDVASYGPLQLLYRPPVEDVDPPGEPATGPGLAAGDAAWLLLLVQHAVPADRSAGGPDNWEGVGRHHAYELLAAAAGARVCLCGQEQGCPLGLGHSGQHVPPAPPADPDTRPRVGDMIRSRDELDRLPTWATVVDTAGCAWQLVKDGRSPEQPSWAVATDQDSGGHTPAYHLPALVVWLPRVEEG